VDFFSSALAPAIWVLPLFAPNVLREPLFFFFHHRALLLRFEFRGESFVHTISPERDLPALRSS